MPEANGRAKVYYTTDGTEPTFASEMYNISPVADLINIRLENSKMMLAYSSMSISEICDATGFSNIYYFSKCFKKNTSMSPSQYRNQFTKPAKKIVFI